MTELTKTIRRRTVDTFAHYQRVVGNSLSELAKAGPFR